MSTSVVKRTGEAFVISWLYAVANESGIDEFRIESSTVATGPFGVAVGGLLPSSRSKSLNAPGVSTYYRVAAVKGTIASYGGNLVQVIIDNTPFPPDAVSVA